MKFVGQVFLEIRAETSETYVTKRTTMPHLWVVTIS